MFTEICRCNLLKKIGSLATGAMLLSYYPIFIERNRIRVNYYTIPVPRLPTPFEGFTLLHLTDLHYGPLVSLSRIRKVVELCHLIRKDCIVCTGDYIDGSNAVREIDTIWPVMGELNAPAGVMSVLGNHDHKGDTDRSMYWMNHTGQNLRHKARKIEKGGAVLWFAGAGDLWQDNVSIDNLLHRIPKHECRILLAHNPDTADTIVEAKPDLVIAGHTHGGQVRLPFIGAPILPVRNKNYTSGLKHSYLDIPVFISRGIGWAFYPIRFNCAPEIAVLKLTRST